MRNFMGYDRRWLDEPHVGDHVGRSIWALGDILATAWIPAAVRPAGDLLNQLVGMLAGDVPLRTAAYVVLGLSRMDSDRLEPAAQLLLERLVEQLGAALRAHRVRRLVLVRGCAQLRQRATVAGAPLGRQCSGARRPRGARPRLAEVARRRMRTRRGRAPASRAPGAAEGRACAGRRRRTATRRRRPRRSRADRLRHHTQSRARTPSDQGVRMVPRPQSFAAAGLRLRDRRLQRRARSRVGERQRGRRVDARVPSSGAPSRRCRCSRRRAGELTSQLALV